MTSELEQHILKITKASGLFKIESVQELWGGYGEIVRYGLNDSVIDRVVVKHVKFPKNRTSTADSSRSHERKVRSYQVETAFYKEWSKRCDAACRIPECFAVENRGDEVLMVFEDLERAGFTRKKHSVSMKETKVCLSWLAHFHALFMGEKPKHLWKTGTYWHLATRPDELRALDNGTLKTKAKEIDSILSESPFMTFVHGDAKLANFCFTPDGTRVAAVDFQYVGGGCGMKDVAYLIGSCFYEDQCAQVEKNLLNYYFSELKAALARYGKEVDPLRVEKYWRPLYAFAWTDFYRFLKGWSPGGYATSRYSEAMLDKVVKILDRRAAIKKENS